MSAVSRPFALRESRGRPLPAAAVILWSAFAAFAVYLLAGSALDDFFVTYRYALNLAEGHGFVYNPGERVLGLTNPGLGLLLAGLYLLTGLEIPWMATAIFAFGLLGFVLLLLREGLHRGRGIEAFLGGTLVLVSTYIWICHGGAASMVLLLLVAAATLAGRAPTGAGTVAGLAVWCRPEALLGVLLLGLLRWREGRRVPWIYAFTASTIIGLGALWAWAYFGTVLPITLESKQLLAELGNNNSGGIDFWSEARPLWRRHGGILALEIVVIGLAGQVFVLRHGGRGAKLLCLYGLALALAYPLLGVPFFSWYTVPVAAAILYGAAYFAIHFGRILGRWIGESEGGPWIGRVQDGPRIGFAVSVALVTLVLFSFGERNWRIFQNYSWHHRMELYHEAAEWIRENSAATDEVSSLEIGVVGFYSRRPLQDLLGMVTPRALPFVAEKNIQGVLRNHPTELLLRYNHGGRFDGLFKTRWFRRNYRLAHSVANTDESHVVRIYRRKKAPGRSRASRAAPAQGGSS